MNDSTLNTKNSMNNIKIIEFSNCGCGDGQFITKHCDLLCGLKKFDERCFKIAVSNIPGAMLGGYNYRLEVYDNFEQIEQFLRNWAFPNQLVRPLNFIIPKKKRS